MGEVTGIGWTDHTYNPWIGCTKVSPGCDFCYAEHLMDHRLHRVQWGPHGTRSRTSEHTLNQPLRWNRRAKEAGVVRRVFCASLADVFDNQAPQHWFDELLDMVEECDSLEWQLLTKRPENVAKRLRGRAWPANAALGVSAEDQERANLRIPKLIDLADRLKPAYAFISAEPLLGPIAFKDVPGFNRINLSLWGWWVITGGESGADARPMNPQWARDIIAQCRNAGVPVFHKQNGEYVSVSEVEGEGEHFTFPDGRTVRRVGRELAGNTIDGVVHEEFARSRYHRVAA